MFLNLFKHGSYTGTHRINISKKISSNLEFNIINMTILLDKKNEPVFLASFESPT